MRHIIYNIARSCKASLLMAIMLLGSVAAMAQITQVHGTVSDDFGPLMGATVCEIDGNGRIVESTVTDMNGNFNMKVKNPEKNKLRFSYVGLKTQTLKFDKTTYEIMMASATTLNEVTVTSKKRMTGNSLPIPDKEITFAKQGISAKDFEGLGINSIDEALQGRIAGLDIVGGGGPGSGSTIRLRGASSLSSNTNNNPLVVVDGNIREVDMSTFDANNSEMNEMMAQILNINPEDIEDLQVLQDGVGAAIYGSQGSNGVIEIKTKRGKRGKPQVSYTFKLTATYQPQGMKLLSGDDYSMMLKEEYFNPRQDDNASDVNEINYDPTFSEFQQYNNNTDWRDAVTKIGWRQNHGLQISGGGERAAFRISGGYDHEDYCVIGKGMNRFSTRVNLDYNVSTRIRVSTNFSLMYTKYQHNSDDLLGIARRKMPNMGIYMQDPTTGEDTNEYYNMIQSGQYIGSEIFKDDQRNYVNPVASANLAKHENTQYDITPELVMTYELLGLDSDHHRLQYRGNVYMTIFNNYTDKFYPQELLTLAWGSGRLNTSNTYSSKRVSLNTKHEFTFTPAFKNKDHSLMARARFELSTWNNNSQSTDGNGLPSGGIESPTAGGNIGSLSSSYNNGRSLAFMFNSHYAYKERYMFDANVRAEGTTRLGPNQRWVYIPAVSLGWNVAEEKFMETIREKFLSEFRLSGSWAYTAQQPWSDFLYTSRYTASSSSYLGQSAMIPQNLRLSDLRCERGSNFNFQVHLGLLNNLISMDVNLFNNTRTDMLMPGYRIPSSAGYTTIGSYNTGKQRNTGWSVAINGNSIIKKGKFSMDAYVNFSNERSRLLEMDPVVLKSMNTTFNNSNAQVLARVQLDNPLNAIYGFRSKGVYQYKYQTIKEMTISNEQARAAGIQGWENMSVQQKQQAWIDAGHTAPVALNKDGKIIRDDQGDPIQMKFNYAADGTGTGGYGYDYKGGDAIYEDINHDGQINALDIVYLGSSLPKVYGGFGFTFKYGAWRLSTNFTYRVGVDIINMSRLQAEAMVNNNNQSQAVNYRWRKEGDVTSIPRAMYGTDSNYNTLLSDRFVEDGSYLRLQFLQLSYNLNKKQLKWIGLNSINFYCSANNLLCFTKYTGVDPDVSARGNQPAVDNLQIPREKSFTFGMTVNF